MKPILEIQNISKKYLIKGKQRPYLSIGDSLSELFKSNKAEASDFWALTDVSFTVFPGDAIGIIGKNGSGKSTLLKVLSKITPPTLGKIISRGRIASLLEVGTGFHSELSGRENIFFNGSILGMKRVEVQKHFDSIVDFSGVEKFIDTPLKHYSSGMQLRLAFAVAAFLEPEILIIDEVLAVGDAEFQKKCMGKMQDVSKKEGRTVLFVSHNITSVKALCNKGILLKKGCLCAEDSINEITRLYLEEEINLQTEQIWDIETNAPGNNKIRMKRAAVFAEGKTSFSPITTKDNIVIEIDFYNQLKAANVDVTIDIFDNNGVHVTHVGMVCKPDTGLNIGVYRTRAQIPGNLLNTNRYIFNVIFGLNQREVIYKHDDLLVVDIEDAISNRGNNFNKFPGVIHPVCKWETFLVN